MSYNEFEKYKTHELLAIDTLPEQSVPQADNANEISDHAPATNTRSSNSFLRSQSFFGNAALSRTFGGSVEKPTNFAETAEAFLSLQERTGNQAAARFIQHKLRVGQPRDSYEREADETAEKVVRRSTTSFSIQSGDRVSTSSTAINTFEHPIRRLPAVGEEEPEIEAPLETDGGGVGPVQQVSNGSPGPGPGGSLVEEVAGQAIRDRGAGEPLTPGVRSRLEGSLNEDLSGLRVHSDSRAREATDALHARAFTHGENIFLGRGEQQSDLGLMAHEATHVVQQRGSNGGAFGASASPSAVNRTEPESQTRPNDQQAAVSTDGASVAGTSQTATVPEVESPQSLAADSAVAEPEAASDTASAAPSEAVQPEGEAEPGPNAVQQAGPEADAEGGEEPSGATAAMAEGETTAVSPAQAAAAPAEAVAEDAGVAEPSEEASAPGEEAAVGAATPATQTGGRANAPESAPAATPEPAGAAGPPVAENNPVSSLINARAQSLEVEAQAIAERVLGGKTARVEQRSSAPEVQFDLWDDIKGVAGRGVDWVGDNVVAPIRNLGSRALAGINRWAGHIAAAWHETEFRGWDIVQLPQFVLRFNHNFRKRAWGEVIANERRERLRAMAQAGHPTTEAQLEPSFLENLDSMADRVDEGADAVFGVQKEILEGAVLGDFQENPTIWNTIGQIAIGFVPYAGQVADIRDLIAGVIKLHESGYKDPWAWFNIVLIGIGFIPGLGDIIKSAGRALKPTIRKALSAIGRRLRPVWEAIVRHAPELYRGAKAIGRKLLNGARLAGRKLLERGRIIGERVLGAGRSAMEKGRRLLAGAGERISSMARRAMEGVRGAVEQARGLANRISQRIARGISQAIDAVRNLVERGMNTVRRAMDIGRRIVAQITQGVSQALRRAAEFAKNTIRQAIEHGKALWQSIRQRVTTYVRNKLQQGRQIVVQGYNGVRNLLRRGIHWVGSVAIPFVKRKLRELKERLLKFLKDKWEALKRKFQPGRATIPNDPNRLHHIFGQPEHNWHLTGLSQAENIKLIERVANEPANFVRSFPVKPNGQVHIFEAAHGGNTIEVRVREEVTGARSISDAWVK